MIAFGRSDFGKRLPGISMLVAAVLCAFFLTSIASASASTRTLKLYFTHTKERAEITFKRNGRYDKEGLRKLNNFLRDWRQNEPTKMDPELFDLIWEVYQKAGTSKYIHVVSAYRSPKTNNMLRKRSSGVAKNSQHTRGRAMDFFIPGVSTAKLRALGLRQHVGGVGYYPRSNTPFVHMDTGSVRHWPRMTRSQLVKVFPKGDTIHVPSDGKPLARYKQTLAEVKRRDSGRSTSVASRSSSSSKASARATSSNSGGGFFSRLFSNSDSNEASKPAPTPATKAPREREPDPSRRVENEFNAIPQPKVALLATQPAASPVPGAASPLALASITPYAKPKAETEAAPEATEQNLNLFASARPRIKPQQIIQVAALPAATPATPQRAPIIPQKVETPKDGIAAIIAATGEKTPDSLRPLVNSQLAYASPASGNDQAKNKFNKKSALSAQAPFAEQRLPNLLPPKPQSAQQTVISKAVHKAPLTGFHSAPKADAVLMLDPTWTARNRRTITMEHPDQNQLAVLMSPVTSVLKDALTQTPYRPIRKSINRGSAIAWLDSIYTGSVKVSSR
ncbi:Uncharacterized conserved protein YcbK, DUF882 family [Pseudovibrio denitrificans]|uniref:Murein endopeptidase K n=1 Tax=Pseudovibrio denitrificans TaxID=258256 RepID=A0A1I7DM01_9HYPH|nr:DUF882 domain-containing protein [Pseudovibrio denitrificans]SFU12687.1 Uncharacterized conserved protein YcbK, DUF882 family [Pseudovibrio denitrificans]